MDINKFIFSNDTDFLVDSMLASYHDAEKQINAQLEKIYARILSGVKPEDMYNVMLQKGRLESMLTEIQGIYKDINTNSSIYEISEYNLYNTYYKTQFALSNIPGMEVSFTRIDTDLMKLITRGTQDSWNTIADKISKEYALIYQPQYGSLSELLKNKERELLAEIQQKITSGFINGYSIDKMSSMIQDIMDNARYQAERIARTEATRCANSGFLAASQDASDQLGEDVKIQKQWLAADVDVKHHEHVADLDGMIVDLDEPFKMKNGLEAMYPGDFDEVGENINCLCTIINIINGKEPELKAARDPETGEQGFNTPEGFKSYDDFLNDNDIEI
jgi:hypothetical protein